MDTVAEIAESVEPASAQQLLQLKQHLNDALELSLQLARNNRPPWGPHAKRLRAFLDFVEEQHAASMDGCALPTSPAQASRFAALLQSKREAAHLSHSELAKLAGLSAKTIANIEKGKVSVSRLTLQRLREVAQLDLQTGDVVKAIKEDEQGYNCHIPRGYDTLEMVTALSKLLNGPGGHIEQTNAYLEHRSAMAYIAECQNPTYVSRFREAYPSKNIVTKIISETGQAAFKVIAIGPGDGHLEVRLIQHLLGKLQEPDIKFVLFDISQPLLTAAYQHTVDVLGPRSPVETVMVQGNFHGMAQYPQVTATDSKSSGRQTRIYLMLGNTLANLDHEPRFFQHNFSHCQPGDFLVLDIQQRTSPASATEAEIRQSDPALSSPYPVSKEEWLSTPLRIHCPDLTSCRFSLELEMPCPIPGSYMLDNIATVRVKGQPEKRFSIFRHKRYDAELLKRALLRFGWECVTSIAFGPDKAAVALLLVKREHPQKH